MARRLEASDQKARELAKKLDARSFSNEEGEEYAASTFSGLGDYQRNKRTKIQNRDAYIRAEHASLHPPIFRGLAIWINGETYPTPYELGQLIVKHSGVRFQYLDGKTQVTHIIASNLTLKKRVEFARYRVVRPEWITESVKAGALLPWSEFRLIDETPGQRKLSFSSPAIAQGGSDDGDSSPQNSMGMLLEVKKVVDRPIANPGSSFIKRAVSRQIFEAGLLGIDKVDRQISTPGAKKAVDTDHYISRSTATLGSSSIKKVVDHPRPGSSSLPRDFIIPPSDEFDLDEDEFPSYQLPADNTSFTSITGHQSQQLLSDRDEIHLSTPQANSKNHPHSFEGKEKIAPSSWKDREDEDLEPVNLVFMPPTSPIFPKDVAQEYNPMTPKSKIFQSTNSQPPPNTFPPHLAQKVPGNQKIRTPLVAEKTLPSKQSSKPEPSLRPEPVTIINGQEAYEVESFIGENSYPKRKNRRAWTEYLVLWKGYPPEEASWEPERQLKQDLKDGEFDKLLREWQKKQRKENGSECGDESGKTKGPVKLSQKARGGSEAGDDRNIGAMVVEPIAEGSSPGSVIVVQQPPEKETAVKQLAEKEYATGHVGSVRQAGSETTLAADTGVELELGNGIKEVKDSLSPEDLMDEDEDFGWGIEDERMTGIKSDELFNGIANGLGAGAPTLSTVDKLHQVESSQKEVIPFPSGSFESVYGTPVGFAGGIKTIGPEEDPNIPEALGPAAEDIFVSPVDFAEPMEEGEGEKVEKMDFSVDLNVLEDSEPFKMESLTPVKLLQERETLSMPEGSPKATEPLNQPSELLKEMPTLALEENTSLETTAEQKMARYLSTPGIREQTCLNPGFLQKYHEESRLHQLSTWKAKLRAEFQVLAEAKSSPEHTKSKKSRPRSYILHVDFDCFFAAVSTRDRPDLSGKPVAIAHGNAENSTTSEIASCNYSAREFGVKNGMWMEEAKKLCPNITCLPYEFPKYEVASKAFYEEILSIGAEKVQAVSVDEVLVDISNLCCDMELEIEQEESMASVIATQIRDNCRAKTGGLEVSIGIGRNVLLAKLATKKAKPAGQYLIKNSSILDFMGEVAVRDLPGIGYNIAKKVEEKLGTSIVGEVRGFSKERLKNVLGEKTGEKLWGYCRGLDDTAVGQTTVRKSVSVDVNWGVRFENEEQAEKFVMDIAEEVEKRMKLEGVKGKHLTLKVNKRATNAPFITPKHLGCGKCDTLNKSMTLGVSTSSGNIIGKEAVAMLRTCRISPGELRGLGLTMTRLERAQNKSEPSQKRLEYFKKAPLKEPMGKNNERGKGEKSGVIMGEANIPPERPLIKTYAKPKVTTLLDSFSIISAARKEKVQLMQVQQESSVTPAALKGEVQMQQESKWQPDNSIGTQIDISMGVDPDVLPYLPTEHRNYIMQKMKEKEEAEEQKRIENSLLPQPLSQPPPGSQYDIEIWNQLGSEMRAEIIAEHEAENKRIGKGQTPISPPKTKPLPPSPRKNKSLPWANNTTPPHSPRKIKPLPSKKSGINSPPKKKRGRPPVTKAGPSGTNNPEKITDMKGNDVSSWLFDEGEVDREWFDAVDEESRQHQIAQAVKTRELRFEAARKQELKESAERERLANAVRLPMPSRQYTLGSGRAVGTIEQIRNTLLDWYERCAEIGPHEEDIEEFAKFLKRLVLVENNIPKADEAVRFFLTIVGHEEGEWRIVLEEFAKAVNGALDQLELAPIDFGIGDNN